MLEAPPQPQMHQLRVPQLLRNYFYQLISVERLHFITNRSIDMFSSKKTFLPHLAIYNPAANS